MNDIVTIPLAELENKLSLLQKDKKPLLDGLQRIEEEEKHIHYVINNFTSKNIQAQAKVEIAKQPFWKRQEYPELRVLSDVGRGAKVAAIENVLRDSGKPMKSKDVRDELERRGASMTQASFDNIVSIESRNPQSHIRRTDYGTYQYAA
jgi:hypothetical protein